MNCRQLLKITLKGFIIFPDTPVEFPLSRFRFQPEESGMDWGLLVNQSRPDELLIPVPVIG